MKKIFISTLIASLIFCVGSAFADNTAESLINSAVSMIQEFATKKDAADIADILKDSYAIAIVPSMVKAGFVLGGEYGEGLILVRSKGKWYGPSFYNIGGTSLGFQIGAQNISLLLAVVNQKGVRAFLNSKTKLGGDIAVTAGPIGRRAEAATDAQAKASIYSYSMTKGLFAGVSLEGSVISISVKRNREYWGKNITASDAIIKPATGAKIKPLLNALDSLIKRKK